MRVLGRVAVVTGKPSMMTDAPLKSELDALLQQVNRLQTRIIELEQENSDLEIALQTAIEHGDIIDREISANNRKLVAEVAERVRAEARLARLIDALHQQKADLEILVATVSEHSDDIDNQWLKRFGEAETHALTDDLTGIANRRAFNSTLERNWHRCLRTKSPIGLVMLDVDHFKQYNDAYGHQAGDRCLFEIAQLFKKSCRRPEDFVARYGGEEFMLVLPDTNLEGATRVVEDIRGNLAERALPHCVPPGVVTVSAGVVAEVPTSERDVATLIAEADRRLYGAKNDGRNTYRTS